MAAFDVEKVTDVTHWTDRLFSFRTTRKQGFRFENGQFVMLGLKLDGKPLVRAYSIASANFEEHLEFYSIKVPAGSLTSRLQHIEVGDEVMVGHKPTGTLVQDSLTPGRHLYLVSTGTGLAPFASVIKDPAVYERFERVALLHGCRYVAELGYGQKVVDTVVNDEILGEFVDGRLSYYPTVTRESFVNTGRVTDGLADGSIPKALGLAPLDPAVDRVMICGSEAMLADMVGLLERRGFREGTGARPAEYVIEKAFAEK